MFPRTLDPILKPGSVAVIGASNQSDKVGGICLRNLLHAGFEGPLFAVNPRHEEVQGIKAYRSIGELPQAVDLAIVCTPASTVPQLVDQCGQAGVRGMIILTAGFGETGTSGRQANTALGSQLQKYPHLRVVGPNCLGIMVPGSRLNASFAASMPLPGRVAFVSQSGALCTAMLDWAGERALGFSCFVSIGNMLDVDLADLLDYLLVDAATDAVILYIESVTNARRFMSAARACARHKPVVAFKAGRFTLSAKAAASHTGAMAGVDSVYEAAFERAGIVRVFEVDELFDCAQLLANGPRIRGERLAIVTNAGGPGVIACDALLARNGKAAELSESTIRKLDQILPPAWSRANPVDVLGDATPERFAQAVEIVAADEGVDALLSILTPQAMTDPTATANALMSVAQHSAKPILANWMGGGLVRQGVELLNHAGVPTAPTPDDAIAAFMHLVRYRRNLDLLYEMPREVPIDFDGTRDQIRANLKPLFDSPHDILFESEAKRFLAAYGIPVTLSQEGQSPDEVVSIARSLGFPVVLKVVSPQITHKTDAGGVALNLADEQQVQDAYARMLSDVRRANPDAEIHGISVQPMTSLAGGMELILGSKKDPVFGPVVMIGSGGVAAELFHDRALGLPPLNERLALRMLESLRAWPLLKGFRGRKPIANVDRLIELLLRFSSLVADFPEISELDANPVLVRDESVIALDARIVLDRDAIRRPALRRFEHLSIRPYPEDLVEGALLADGTRVTLRPIKPEDEGRWHELLLACSPESLWNRFRFMFRTETHEAAIRFCFVDYDRELTAVAEAHIEGARKLLGVSRLVSDAGTSRGEFAVLVGERWQGKGLGRLLTQYCIRHADRIGVRQIYATTARTNTRMLRIFGGFGFELVSDDDPTLMSATKAVV